MALNTNYNSGDPFGSTDVDAITTALQGVMDNIVQQALGTRGTGYTVSDVNSALTSLVATTRANSTAIQNLTVAAQQAGASGATYSVNFNNYPDGPFPSVFTLTSTGLGNGSLHISGGMASWVQCTNGQDNSITGIYNAGVTTTDYQWLNATVGGMPGSGGGYNAANYGLVRVKDANNYVYAKGYLVGGAFAYAELGCYVNGTKHVFATDVPATYNYNLGIVAGVYGVDPYRFQVISGDTVVIDLVDTNHISQLGADYRGWGFRSETGMNGSLAPAPATFVGVSDNSPVSVVGTGLKVCRKSTNVINLTTGSDRKFPNSFWDNTVLTTSNITWNQTTGTATILKAGWYVVKLWAQASGSPGGNTTPLIWQNGAVVSGSGTATASYYSSYVGFGDVTLLYCAINDTVVAGYNTGGCSVVGESTGTKTVFSIALVNPG